jgi:hypothetical protein
MDHPNGGYAGAIGLVDEGLQLRDRLVGGQTVQIKLRICRS